MDDFFYSSALIKTALAVIMFCAKNIDFYSPIQWCFLKLFFCSTKLTTPKKKKSKLSVHNPTIDVNAMQTLPPHIGSWPILSVGANKNEELALALAVVNGAKESPWRAEPKALSWKQGRQIKADHRLPA